MIGFELGLGFWEGSCRVRERRVLKMKKGWEVLGVTLILLIKKESYTCVLSGCIGFLFTCALCKAHKAHVYVFSLHARLQIAHV